MKKWLLAVPLLLVGLGCTSQPAPQSDVASADPAVKKPANKAMGAGFYYFVKSECGSNPRAVPLISRLADAYKGKVAFTGVIDVDESGLQKWKGEFPTDIEFNCDPELASMRKFEVTSSQTVLLLDADGKVVGRWDDFGRESLNDLNTKLADQAKVPVEKVDLASAPDRKSYG